VSNWHGPYVRKNTIPADPWGNAYHYISPGQNGDYDLFTLGRDNADGGEDEDSDVVSW
jgi:general secretion pathway protein G